MTVITFDNVTLQNPAPLKPNEDQENFEITIECQTNDFDDVTEIIARSGKSTAQPLLSGKTKIQTTGTLSDLVISGFDSSIDGTYTNCAIMDGVKVEEVFGTGGTWWKYTVKFTQAERAVARPAWYTTAIIGQAPEDVPIAENITTSVALASDNYVDLPISQAVIPGVGHSVILTTDNYADIPISDAILSAITHALTIVNDV